MARITQIKTIREIGIIRGETDRAGARENNNFCYGNTDRPENLREFFRVFRGFRGQTLRMPAKLSTHVLDLTRGAPAAGMEIELWRLDVTPPEQIKVVVTNADGRTDAPLLSGDELVAGDFQLVFKIKDYFAARGEPATFFVYAAVFFRIENPGASYHVPLLVTPWAYSTYRGS